MQFYERIECVHSFVILEYWSCNEEDLCFKYSLTHKNKFSNRLWNTIAAYFLIWKGRIIISDREIAYQERTWMIGTVDHSKI